MRSVTSPVVTGLAGLTLAATMAAPAHAVSAYTHMNYSGGALGGTDRSNVGTMNDQISSVRTYGLSVRFWEDNGYSGRSFTTRSDWNDLRDLASGLHWGETWNDRISSWDTSPYRTF